jgi:cholesterol transport system auxiliary component
MSFAGHARALLLVSLAGCALLTRGKTLPVTYYEPAVPAARAVAAASPGCVLGLGRVDAADHLREEIEYRTPPYEAGYYDERRWTQAPERYLRRSLELGLFESKRCARMLSDAGATLDVSLLSFTEVRSPEAARVSVRVLLHEGPRVLIDTTVETQRPVARASDFDAVVQAMSEALADVVARIADQVEGSLRAEARR